LDENHSISYFDIGVETQVLFQLPVKAGLALSARMQYWEVANLPLIYMYNNNNDRLTAFDPGQPG